MANTREIQSRMKSIQDTMKITSAMYMISSSKLKKAKKSLEDTKPYFYTLQSTISRVLRHIPDMDQKYFDTRSEVKPEDRKIGYIVVTADKGLAGAYNHNVIKLAEESLEQVGVNQLFVVGQVGRQYFMKKGYAIDLDFAYTVQDPKMSRARVISEEMVERFNNHELDEVYIIYTEMVNSMKAEAKIQQLLPLKKADFNMNQIQFEAPMEEIVFWPTPEKVIDTLTPNCIAGYVFGALVESFSSEQNSRMMAMQAATDSATAMLHDLEIIYNRVRQAAITQEITEVISGAKAQKRKKKR